MNVVLAAALLLQAAVLEDVELRAVAVGADVDWYVDDAWAASSLDGQPAILEVDAGAHQIRAEADKPGNWEILVRPQPSGPGIEPVPAWTASQETSESQRPEWLLPASVLVLCIAIVVWPRRTSGAVPRRYYEPMRRLQHWFTRASKKP